MFSKRYRSDFGFCLKVMPDTYIDASADGIGDLLIHHTHEYISIENRIRIQINNRIEIQMR